MDNPAVGQPPHPRHPLVEGVVDLEVLPLELRATLPAIAKLREEDVDVAARGAVSERQHVALRLAHLVEQRRRRRPPRIVERGLVQRPQKTLEEILSAHARRVSIARSRNRRSRRDHSRRVGPEPAPAQRNAQRSGRGVEAPKHHGLTKPHAAGAQLDARESLDQHLERDAPFEARELRPEAVVDAAPEREVRTCVPGDIEAFGVVEGRGITVGGADENDDVVAPAQAESVHLAVLDHAPERRLRRRVVAQQLLDRRGDEPGLFAQPLELGAVAKQGEEAVADEVGGGLVAGDDQQAQHVQHLALGEPFAFVLGLDECAQDVVAGVGAPLLDDRAEVGVERLRGGGADASLAHPDGGFEQPRALRRP